MGIDTTEAKYEVKRTSIALAQDHFAFENCLPKLAFPEHVPGDGLPEEGSALRWDRNSVALWHF